MSAEELTFAQLFMKLQTIHGNWKHFCAAYSCPITLYLRRYATVDMHALYCTALSDNSIALDLYTGELYAGIRENIAWTGANLNT